MSVRMNFMDIYLQGMRERSMRSGMELEQENKANWFLRFQPSHHWRNLFHFSQWGKK